VAKPIRSNNVEVPRQMPEELSEALSGNADLKKRTKGFEVCGPRASLLFQQPLPR